MIFRTQPARHALSCGWLALAVLCCSQCRREGVETQAAAPSPAQPAPAASAPISQTRALTASPQPVSAPTSPATDSDAWVRREFEIQSKFTRVLAVGTPEGSNTVRVRRLQLERSGPSSELEEFAVDERFDTLQQAADAAKGGDLVAVWPGSYVGFELRHPEGTGPGRFIRFTALGEPGQVVIQRGAPKNPSWMLALTDVSYVVVDGFEIVGVNRPGAASPNTPRAGIFIDGAFRASGRMAHHVAIVGCNSRGHRKWGLHSTDSRHVLIQDSYFADSGEEHGCYVSDGSDAYVVRRNVFANNPISGLQCNLDPDSALEELNEHPKMRLDHESTRAFAKRALQQAERLFGAGEFPDGRGTDFIIEANVAHGNGKQGGAAFNLAALSRSVIANNLIYGNHAAGIAQWDNDNSYDYDYHDPGPQSPKEVKGPESFPLFGCQQNLIANNTVFMSVKGRVAVQSIHGSWGTRLYNNVLANGRGDAIEIDNTSIYQFEAGPNAYTSVTWSGKAEGMQSLAKRIPSPEDRTSFDALKAALSGPSDAPWRAASGWKPADSRPDFSPRPTATGLLGSASKQHAPVLDLLGRPREQAALGALEPAVGR